MKSLIFGLFLMASMSLFADAAPSDSNPLVVILLGPPGSGKWTQAQRVAELCGLAHISTGDIFRENVRNETPLGKQAKSFMDAGRLVPDEVVIDMVKERTSKPDTAKGYLLDGFPRTGAQAEAWDAKMPSGANVVVLHLNVSDKTITDRILSRGEGRADDTPEVIAERLRVYHEQTKPLIDHYRRKGQLRDIDGEHSKDEVFEAISRYLPCRLES